MCVRSDSVDKCLSILLMLEVGVLDTGCLSKCRDMTQLKSNSKIPELSCEARLILVWSIYIHKTDFHSINQSIHHYKSRCRVFMKFGEICVSR